MTGQEKMLAKKRGRPATGRGQTVGVRIHDDQLARLDGWRELEEDRPSRPEAIRRLVEKALLKRGRADEADAEGPDGERTTAVGLYNYARSYYAAAGKLSVITVRATHPDAPVTFLYYHAVELFLKSYLRMTRVSLRRLEDVGHRPMTLVREAVSRGLSIEDDDLAIIKLIPKETVLRARYLQTGFFSRARVSALDSLCSSLESTVGQALRGAGMVVRPPPNEQMAR